MLNLGIALTFKNVVVPNCVVRANETVPRYRYKSKNVTSTRAVEREGGGNLRPGHQPTRRPHFEKQLKSEQGSIKM